MTEPEEKAIDWSDNDEFRAVDLAEQIALVKSAVTLPEIAEMAGFDIENGKIRPPWNPTERTPSCHLFEDHFYDFSTGRHGDVFDLLKEMDMAEAGETRSISKMVWDLRRRAVRSGREPGDVDVIPVRQLTEFSHEFDDLETVYTWAGINTYGFGVSRREDGTILVPHFQQDPRPFEPTVYGVKIRQVGGGKSSMPGSQFTHRLYSAQGHGMARSVDCVITEGESDAWAMINALPQTNVFALPSGASSWKDSWMADLVGYTTIHLCFDNDRAGKLALDKVTRKVGYDRAKPLRVPGIFNDAREALGAGWEPRL